MSEIAVIGDQDRRRNSTFGIIKTGGKQYKVKVGDILKIEKIADDAKEIIFDDLLNQTKVSAKILEQGKSDKVNVLKFHAKKRYQRTKGHRQFYTKIQIESIK